MIRRQIYIPEDIDRDLILLAKQERVNYSQLIREGAKEVIKKKKSNKANWRKFVGAAGKIKLKHKTNSVQVVRDYYIHFGE